MNNRRSFDPERLNLMAQRLDRAIFRGVVLGSLFALSIGPAFRNDYPARIIGVIAAGILTALAAPRVFKRRD